MSRTKRVVFLIGSLLVLGLAVPSAALGETWTWTLETHGEDVFWTSPTAVPTGFPQYDWSAQFTLIEAQLRTPFPPPNDKIWSDVTSQFGDTSASGTATALPFNIYADYVNEAGILKLYLSHYVDATGHGQFALTGDDPGTPEVETMFLGIMPGVNWPILGFRATGETAVNAVPEPTGVVLLLTGLLAAGLVALRRRSR